MFQTIPIILDLGSYLTQIGFTGNTTPLFSLKTRDLIDKDIFLSKTVKKYENLESFCSQIFTEYLNIDPEEKIFILTESAFEDRNSRHKIMEIFFESFTVDKLALINDAIASLYSFKKTEKKQFNIKNMNALLVETGHLQTSIVPIVEGHIIQHGLFNYPINGNYITQQISKHIKQNNPDIVKKYSNKQISNISEIFKHEHTQLDFEKFKPKLGQSIQNIQFLDNDISLKIDDVYKSPLNMYFEPTDFQQKISKNLAFYISESINGCPFDVKDINIVLSGYCCNIKNFAQRFKVNMNDSANNKKLRESLKVRQTQLNQHLENFKIEINVQENKNGQNSAWIGIAQMYEDNLINNKFISSQLYDEYGDSLARRNFFAFNQFI